MTYYNVTGDGLNHGHHPKQHALYIESLVVEFGSVVREMRLRAGETDRYA